MTALSLQKDSFHKYDQVYHFQNSFVTLSRYHSLGSIQVIKHNLCGWIKCLLILQSIIEKYLLIKKMRVPESLVDYIAAEMFSVVGHLHNCGIIHAALKPAHFLIRDIRSVREGVPTPNWVAIELGLMCLPMVDCVAVQRPC